MFGKDLSEFAISLYILVCIYGLSCLLPDLKTKEEVQRKLGLPAHKFLEHIESRWLPLAPALYRIVEQFDGLKEYFLVDVPAKQNSILYNKTYKKISDQIKHKYILTKIDLLQQLLIYSTNFL